MAEIRADVVVVGAGVGGLAAALAAAKMGKSVVVTEETDWIGGQLTSQAVPPDENRWIETFGSTHLYRQYRERVRRYYERNYPLSLKARQSLYFNPGNGSVSRLCHEPRVSLAVLQEMVAPYQSSGKITILLNHQAVAADAEHDKVHSVTVKNPASGLLVTLTGDMFVDATELGDLLALTGTEYVTGSESQSMTGELHAHAGEARPLNMQAITVCFAVDHLAGQDHTIERPPSYSFWRDYVPELTPGWPDKLFSWTHPVPTTLQPVTRHLFDSPADSSSLFRYRRILDRTNFDESLHSSDISLVNWPQTDYWLGPVCEVEHDIAAQHVEGARQLSLSFLYWMQTEAPRPDGGVGYPGLRLRKDIVGTEDGLAKYPYIRESRRIQAVFTVTEEHVGREMRGGHKAEYFPDSVGIGHYNIDLHPSTGGDNYIDVPSLPFQIPLGCLIPIRVQNLLPACKNIGTTHITNGCYRLHPVEWNIGESVGYLASYCIDHNISPIGVHASPARVSELQSLLVSQGVELSWPNIGP